MSERGIWRGVAAGLIVFSVGSPAGAQITSQADKPTPPLAAEPRGGLANLAAQFEKAPDTVVATVNGTPITAGMIADHIRDLSSNLAALSPSLIYQKSLEDLVQQRSLAVKARELGIDKDATIKRRIQEATDHELANALILHIMPEMVTEQAIQARYDATIAGRPGPVEVQFRVIATQDEATANLALDALRKGTDFAAVARRFSIDATKMDGGEAGFASRAQLTPEIGAIAFTLMPGQTTQFPAPSGGKWFIVNVEGRRQQASPTLEASRAELRAELMREAALEIIKKARSAVVVEDFGPTGMRKGSP